MNTNQRLKEAQESVLFDADGTWAPPEDAFHTSNLQLINLAQSLQNIQSQHYRPRTVRECIPNSRLAKYNNYVYNESREMSYAADGSTSTPSLDKPTDPKFVTEPWELSEVDELFRWFTRNPPKPNFPRTKRYESPLLQVSGFEDKILKIQITEDRIKNLWGLAHPSERRTPRLIPCTLYVTPVRTHLLNPVSTPHPDWFRKQSTAHDFQQITLFTNTLRQQLNVAMREPPPEPPTPPPSDMLYSEVVQGACASKRPPPKVEQAPFAVLGGKRAIRPPPAPVAPVLLYSNGLPKWPSPAQWCLGEVKEGVRSSPSEELETQALEQYSNSNELFYQELERQAAEQYAGYQE